MTEKLQEDRRWEMQQAAISTTIFNTPNKQYVYVTLIYVGIYNPLSHLIFSPFLSLCLHSVTEIRGHYGTPSSPLRTRVRALLFCSQLCHAILSPDCFRPLFLSKTCVEHHIYLDLANSDDSFGIFSLTFMPLSSLSCRREKWVFRIGSRALVCRLECCYSNVFSMRFSRLLMCLVISSFLGFVLNVEPRTVPAMLSLHHHSLGI